MKAKTVRNKIIIVGGLSACLLLGGCGAGQAADATSAESTFAAQESTVTPTESTETAETVSTETAQDKAQLPDGVYTAEFSTDSSMFHVSEACDGKGTLTVKDGVMTIHISLGSKKILNLYPGLAEDAAKDGAVLLELLELEELFDEEVLAVCLASACAALASASASAFLAAACACSSSAIIR